MWVIIIFTGTSLTAVPIYCSFTMDLLDLLVHWSDLVYLLVLVYCYCSDWTRMCSRKLFLFLISVGLSYLFNSICTLMHQLAFAGHKAFLGFFYLDYAYNNAVVHVFVQILKESVCKDLSMPVVQNPLEGNISSKMNIYSLSSSKYKRCYCMVSWRGKGG